MNYKEKYLTVRELKDAINKLDSSFDDHIVIMSKDSEGNLYKVMNKEDFLYTNYKFVPHQNEWTGDVFIKELTDKLIEQGYSELDLTNDKSAIDCILLYPMD